MTSREKLELRYIADRLAVEISGCTDGEFIIDRHTLHRLLELVDRANSRPIRCRRCLEMEERIDAARGTLLLEIEEIQDQLKEYKKLPRLVF